MKKVLLISVSVLAMSAGAAFAGNVSDVDQIGSSNTVVTDQTAGGGTSNYSGIIQNASNSSATVTQIGLAYGSDLDSRINQAGQWQKAEVKQDAHNGLNDERQKSVINQSNWNNQATVSQNGKNDNSTIKQSGANSNTTTNKYVTGYGWVNGGVNVTQKGVAENKSDVDQSSNYSGVYVSQDSTLGGVNHSEVQQWGGTDNYAAVQQSGSQPNTSWVTQKGGSYNTVSINQH
ncbi:hypothetical protein Rvan_2067 [Rhodomicrobium vannielii ATCC 17100]|uniref:Curlin associated repeat-containing protein n=1 Tax=Rhodomicrobium vannielii (strain ATCC 17100 / DSM 162 / LMG 4299 / NCIMB 10020 / ATH 3.1.1) TaxID=648757 RepID=E3I1Z3_RHOVT|nr:hypothetical protein [Rhodomicrobium vannielii]ADP71294.1 hypothetical protein Rvan_2067 [Rhodomicrobium vannielii ATCC 17100]